MKSVFAASFLVVPLWAASAAVSAEPLFGADDLQRNGAISRHVWKPDFASADVAGVRLSAGLAIGLRGPLHSQLGRSVTPALSMNIGHRSSLSLLPAGGRGAMLVLQTTH